MNKKTLMSMMTCFAFGVMLCMTTSCGGEDGQDILDDTPQNPTDDTNFELSETSLKFVGHWILNIGGSGHTFTFFPNGVAIRDNEVVGKWQYIADAHILSTTIDLWQFSIIATYDDSWTATTISTERAVNAKKGDSDGFLRGYLAAVTFYGKKDDGSTYYPFELEKEKRTKDYYKYSGKYSSEYVYQTKQVMSLKNIEIQNNHISATATVKWETRSSYYSTYKEHSFEGTLVVDNPFTNEPVLTITGSSSHEQLAPGTYTGKWVY